MLENIIQEVDIQTGKLLMEWRSLDHVPISDFYRKVVESGDHPDRTMSSSTAAAK